MLCMLLHMLNMLLKTAREGTCPKHNALMTPVTHAALSGSHSYPSVSPLCRTVPRNDNAGQSRLERDQIFAAVEGSLRRLQTHYIDLIQLHWPDR